MAPDKRHSPVIDKANSGAQEVSTDHLDAALENFVTSLPPFIDLDIPQSTKPGDSLAVWTETGSGDWPRESSPKSFVVCRKWKNTSHKYWTYDFSEHRYIVKGCDEVSDLGWTAWNVWHGLAYGFTKKRVLFTKAAAPPKKTKHLLSGTGRASRQSDEKPNQQYDLNQGFRKAAHDLELAEKTLKRRSGSCQTKVSPRAKPRNTSSPGGLGNQRPVIPSAQLVGSLPQLTVSQSPHGARTATANKSRIPVSALNLNHRNSPAPSPSAEPASLLSEDEGIAQLSFEHSTPSAYSLPQPGSTSTLTAPSRETHPQPTTVDGHQSSPPGTPSPSDSDTPLISRLPKYRKQSHNVSVHDQRRAQPEIPAIATVSSSKEPLPSSGTDHQHTHPNAPIQPGTDHQNTHPNASPQPGAYPSTAATKHYMQNHSTSVLPQQAPPAAQPTPACSERASDSPSMIKLETTETKPMNLSSAHNAINDAVSSQTFGEPDLTAEEASILRERDEVQSEIEDLRMQMKLKKLERQELDVQNRLHALQAKKAQCMSAAGQQRASMLSSPFSAQPGRGQGTLKRQANGKEVIDMTVDD